MVDLAGQLWCHGKKRAIAVVAGRSKAVLHVVGGACSFSCSFKCPSHTPVALSGMQEVARHFGVSVAVRLHRFGR